MSSNGESREQSIQRFKSAMAAVAGRIGGEAAVNDATLALIADGAEAFAAKVTGTGAWGYVTGGGNPDAAGAFVIGLSHADPLATARITTVGDVVEGTFALGRAFEGPKGAVHGGNLARILDDLCAIAQSVGGTRRRLTRQLDITYHRPAPLETLLTVRAEVVVADGPAVTVRGTIRDGEVLCVEATAVFVSPGGDARADL